MWPETSRQPQGASGYGNWHELAPIEIDHATMAQERDRQFCGARQHGSGESEAKRSPKWPYNSRDLGLVTSGFRPTRSLNLTVLGRFTATTLRVSSPSIPCSVTWDNG